MVSDVNLHPYTAALFEMITKKQRRKVTPVTPLPRIIAGPAIKVVAPGTVDVGAGAFGQAAAGAAGAEKKEEGGVDFAGDEAAAVMEESMMKRGGWEFSYEEAKEAVNEVLTKQEAGLVPSLSVVPCSTYYT